MKIILASGLLLFAVAGWGARPDDIKLDIEIRSAVQTYWKPCVLYCGWKWYKAQLIAESSLNIDAVSPVGAKGLSQSMDPTWKDWQKRGIVPEWATPFDWKWSVRGGAYHMQFLKNLWSSERTNRDRLFLALASYNAGQGNILKAQSLCGGATSYQEIIKCLPNVTCENSGETINYAPKIERIWGKISG